MMNTHAMAQEHVRRTEQYLAKVEANGASEDDVATVREAVEGAREVLASIPKPDPTAPTLLGQLAAVFRRVASDAVTPAPTVQIFKRGEYRSLSPQGPIEHVARIKKGDHRYAADLFVYESDRQGAALAYRVTRDGKRRSLVLFREGAELDAIELAIQRTRAAIDRRKAIAATS
jgi:hypothetical protein